MSECGLRPDRRQRLKKARNGSTPPPLRALGKVPKGYWLDRENRRQYLEWLGQRLGFETYEDWHELTRHHLKANRGGGLLESVYDDSPYAALRDLMPEHEWKPWLMASTPQGFWRDRRNRVWFMDWLGRQLGFEADEDWQRLRQIHFYQHGGGGLLDNYYGGSPLRALKDYKPHVRWREWEFGCVSVGFWRDPANRAWFMGWLGQKLGMKHPEDWYRLTARHIEQHGGGAMLRVFRTGHPVEVLREYRPGHDWKPWLFHRVPRGYWKDLSNQARYVRWLGRQLGFRRRADWYHLEPIHLELTGGGGLLSAYYSRSLTRLLETHFPQGRWDPKRLEATQDPQLTERLIQQRAVQAHRAMDRVPALQPSPGFGSAGFVPCEALRRHFCYSCSAADRPQKKLKRERRFL